MRIAQNIMVLLMLIGAITSCKKQRGDELAYSEWQVGGNITINDFEIVNDSLMIAVTGEEHTAGYTYTSNDGGATWNEQSLSLDKMPLSIHFRDDLNGYIGAEMSHFYKTTDGGQSWQVHWLQANELSFHEVHRTNIRQFYWVNDTVGYFVGGQNYQVGCFYSTSDNGLSWQFDTLDHEIRSIDFFDEQSGILGGHGLIAMINDGVLEFCDIQKIFAIGVKMISATEAIFIERDGDIYRTTNGGQDWDRQLKADRFFRRELYLSSFARENNVLAAVGWNGNVLFSKDNGESWAYGHVDKNAHLISVKIYKNEVYAGTTDGRILKISI